MCNPCCIAPGPGHSTVLWLLLLNCEMALKIMENLPLEVARLLPFFFSFFFSGYAAMVGLQLRRTLPCQL